MSLLAKLENPTGMLNRLARGGAWLGAGSASEQGLRFVRNMILARLLAPEAFGLMAIVISVCSLFQVLTGLGVKESIVQNPRGAEKTYLNGAWWLAFGRGLALFLACFVTAPAIARFYEAPELTPLLRVAFLGVLAQSAISVGAFVAVKQMRYPPWVFIQLGGSLIGVATTLVLASVLQGVWALVIGYVTEGFMRCLLSYIICPFRPRWAFDKGDLQALFRFAKGMFGLPVLLLIYNEGAVFAVGKLCTKEALGIFAMSVTLARIPSMFSNQLSELLMPAFSELQRDPRRVNQGILKTTLLAVMFGIPAVFFTAIYAPQILTVAYGPRYAAGALALSLLFLSELLLVCNVPLVSVYLAMGKPSLLRRFSLIRAALILALLWPVTSRWNISGAAAVPLVAMIAAYGFQLARLHDVTVLGIRDYLAIWLRGLVTALPWAALWLCLKLMCGSMSPILNLALVLTISALAVGLFALIARRRPTLLYYLWPFARKSP